MEKGNTTREQDQRFIKATSLVVFELDRSIRGEKNALATRVAAQKLAEANVNPDSNLDLGDAAGPAAESIPREVAEKLAAEHGAEEVLQGIEDLTKEAQGELRK